jgi:ABC-type transport system substrate-binding protein
MRFDFSARSAISRTGLIAVVVLVIVILGVGGYVGLTVSRPATTVTSTLPAATVTSTLPGTTITTVSTTSVPPSLTTSTTSTSIAPAPTTLTYETTAGPEYLDPDVAYYQQDAYYLENEYETLLWYNQSTAQLVPWLAQSYSVSPNQTTVSFTLRSGITFDDGEPLNSSAVYFSFNRLLIMDGSTPTTHGTQYAWELQEALNTSISSGVSGIAQTYNEQYVNEVLGENFVQITGPMTFELHITHLYPITEMIEYNLGDILAPMFVMEHDVGLWNQSSTGYTLPYPTLTGSMSNKILEYFDDEVATCNAGVTPKGCGETFLDPGLNQPTPSLAGTGPYIIESVDQSGDITYKANPNYWGGPYQYMGGQKIVPYFQTIDVKVVYSTTTRELDLRSAAASGQAMTIDLEPINMYDVVNRNGWLVNNALESTIPGVSIYGPYSQFETNWIDFDTNVTNQATGTYYQFQPFADIRFRLAFADSVNITAINKEVNNNLGIVANGVVPPGFPPFGSYNASLPLKYSYNPDEVQDLLLSAMENPITHFTYENGATAPPGMFNNTFGCSAANLEANGGVCSKPVSQTIPVVYMTGDTFDEDLYDQIAGVINNVSTTYNMGLSVTLLPIPSSEYWTLCYSSYYYSYWGGYINDYPWSTDMLAIAYPAGHVYPAANGWNITEFNTLYSQLLNADATGNAAENVAISNKMNSLANQDVMYLWTVYPTAFEVFTSNIKGVYFNPVLLYGYYFAYLS